MWGVRFYLDENDEIGGRICDQIGTDVITSLDFWVGGVPFYEIGEAILKLQRVACEHLGVNELGIRKIVVYQEDE